MRSIGITFVLALLAVLACVLASWQWAGNNFDAVLGAPPTPVGQRIYTHFAPSEVRHIRVNHDGASAHFDLTANGWQATRPWQDRMDPRAAVNIINFTLTLRVEDFAEADEIDPASAGLDDTGISIHLMGPERETLARYKIGRKTPWLASISDLPQPAPTVFIQTRDENRRGHVYACTGDITPLFKDGMKYLRDHRPFYFNPLALQKIRIRAEQGELTLGRDSPQSPWRLVKPLDLATDPAAIKSLIEGVFELQALSISDRASAMLAADASLTKPGQISLISFGSEAETVLEIQQPETPDARTVRATVSSRPDTVFELPLKPADDLVSLADLPLAVNDLRDPTLTNLNIQSLRGILIQPSTGTEILISRTPPRPWIVTIGGNSQEANEERLFALLKTATEGRAIGFESDAATDLSPWGLDRPFLKLRFFGEDKQGLELTLGIDGQGGYFVNRTGTSTVMRVDPSLVASLPVRPYEWRHSRLWSLDRYHLMAIERTSGQESPLELRYLFRDDQWTASSDGEDVTSTLDPGRANFLLGELEGLKVTRWLSPDDVSAANALAAPSLVFRIIEKATDDTGDFAGIITREVALAPGSTGPTPAFYYGRLSSDTHPFLLDRESYGKLATELLENR
jgi:hypothetical protein